MSEWMWCPKCGALMTVITSGHICPLCGYRVPAQTITTTTGTSVEYVPVIRCKDCVKKEICSIFRNARQELGFCAWACRRDTDDK